MKPTAVFTVRKPTDGKPFYCDYCGLGYGEYLACEDGNCFLESETEAMNRFLAKQRLEPQIGGYSDIVDE